MNTTKHPALAPGPLGALQSHALVDFMRSVRRRTLSLIDDLDMNQLIGPKIPTVNPPLWEIGHVAWFAEFWLLRHLKGQRPLLSNGDELYNSTDIAHDARWDLLLPTREKTLDFMATILERCIETVDLPRALTPDERYFSLLVTFHEAMHAEAIAYTRQALAYRPPLIASMQTGISDSADACRGDVEIHGGCYVIGAEREYSFVFDNEKWAHPAILESFRIARAAVTNGEFLAFVEDDGYNRPEFWSADGWRWLQTGGVPELEKSFADFFKKTPGELSPRSDYSSQPRHPIYWQPGENGRWLMRSYDRYVPLDENLPIVHVSYYEAEAYCRWAGRRLPSEAEWEVAASGASIDAGSSDARRYFPWGDTGPLPAHANLDWRAGGVVPVGAHDAGDSIFGCRQMIGNVWEWTASKFRPYPGFTPDPYKEYSQPWFGTHNVLRGGCWATSSYLIRNTWRNFYTPDRRDVWAGFRTCAL